MLRARECPEGGVKERKKTPPSRVLSEGGVSGGVVYEVLKRVVVVENRCVVSKRYVISTVVIEKYINKNNILLVHAQEMLSLG